MTVSTKTYTVTNPIAFAALYLPLPANSLVFLCAAGQPNAEWIVPGVLLLPGVHYLVEGETFVLSSQFTLNPDDMIAVVSFSS